MLSSLAENPNIGVILSDLIVGQGIILSQIYANNMSPLFDSGTP